MATGQKARTGRPEEALQCILDLSRGSCKRWRERSIGECVRKYRRDVKESTDKRDGSTSFADRSISARRSLS